MKYLIIITLFLGLATNSLLHSQAIRITDKKEVQIGKGDSWSTPSGFSTDVHTLTFVDGNFFKRLNPPPNPPVWPGKTNWDWGIQYADRGLSFIYSKYEYYGYTTPPYTRCIPLYPRLLFLSDSGNVGIGTTSPNYALDVSGTVRASNVAVSSDKRLKKDISPLFTKTYDLNKLNSITYKRNYLETEEEQIFDKDTNTHYGFIAQELREIYPELVFEDSHGLLPAQPLSRSMWEESDRFAVAVVDSATEIAPVLVNAIKELNNKIEVLESRDKELLRDSVKNITTSAVLYQNNPNPFDTQTEIKYYIPAVAVNATIYVYDLTGSQILKLDIAGRESGSITINANQLRAGSHGLFSMQPLFASAVVDNATEIDGKEVDTKKMILTGE